MGKDYRGFMSHLAPISIPTLTSEGVSTKRLLASLCPTAAAAKPLPMDKIHPSREPGIHHLLAVRLFSSQGRLPQATKTTYARAHYFTHIPATKEKPHYLITERFEDEITSENIPKLLLEAHSIGKTHGTLEQTPEGLIYLHISSEYVDKLHPLLPSQEAEKPHYAAHIPVISEQEVNRIPWDFEEELGKQFAFTIKDCRRVLLKNTPDTEVIWILTVESPALMLLRERYGLSSKLHSQDFNIVIGIKNKKDSAPLKERECHYFRINPACTFA